MTMLGLGLGLSMFRGIAGAWSPANLPGKIAWYRADSGTNTTTNGGTITSWADQYGLQGAFASAVGTTTYSASAINSKPGITFPGTSRLDSAHSAAWELTSGYSIWLVGKFAALGTFNTLISNGVATGWDNYVNTSPSIVSSHAGIANSSDADAGLAAGTPWVVEITHDGSTLAWFVNGTARGSASIGSPNTNSLPVSIGQRGDAATTMNGSLCEIIALSARPAGAGMTSLKGYLSDRYAITIA